VHNAPKTIVGGEELGAGGLSPRSAINTRTTFGARGFEAISAGVMSAAAGKSFGSSGANNASAGVERRDFANIWRTGRREHLDRGLPRRHIGAAAFVLRLGAM
jgi:hypothetical protein